ncbi:unnamed protein product [Caenorhabditis auriculariae]|uniref:DH domain-containing protein n=1 Tax=Caenorhabditis auriculariae TaxID=2777116 RepID=A0A8S1GN53_9PELO|nr:unnamed protein product [Caenorhabditis auriculariae]
MIPGSGLVAALFAHLKIVEAEVFELSPDGQRWQRMDARLARVCVFNGFEESQPRFVATTPGGLKLIDAVIPFGEKVHKVSEFFVYFRLDGRTIGLNTLSERDTSLLVSFACNTTHFNMFQHSFTASVSRIATFEGDRVVGCEEPPEQSNMSLSPLNMSFDYRGSPVVIDLLESFACGSEMQPDAVEVAHGANVFRLAVPSHAHLFLIQALNISSLLLARTTSSSVAIGYLQHQHEKLLQKIALLKSTGASEGKIQEDMLALKRIVVQQRLAALQQTFLPDFQGVEKDLCSEEARRHVLPSSRLPSIFLHFFNMHSFRVWRKQVDLCDFRRTSPPSTSATTPTYPSSTTFQTFPGKTREASTSLADACDHRRRQMAQESAVPSTSDRMAVLQLDGEDYRVRKTNGRLGLTIYAHNDEGVIKAEVRGVTSFAPRCAAVGDIVVGVDGELISSVRCAADVERLLRQGKVIHLRRRRAAQKVTVIEPPGKTLEKANLVVNCNKLVLALQELLITEKKYVQDLKEMNEVFLCIRLVREIMHSALGLVKIQTSFVESLEEAIGDVIKQETSSAQMRDSVTRVCAVFVNRCADFKIYAEYAAAYLRLQQEIKHHKELLSKLEAVNSSREQHCSYESRMIKPVQRIVQYPLLLKNILDACDKDAFERKQVESALQKMQTLTEYVNEMQRLHEEYAQQIDVVRKAHEALLLEKGVRMDTRDLLIFAHIRWIDAPSEHYVVFVFQTLILLLPSYARREMKMKWTRVLPINEVEVEELPNDAVNLRFVHAAFESPNGQLSHSNPNTVYHIECCQPQLKQQLIKSVKKARANFVRESRRPLSGSSQSDGGYVSEASKEQIPRPHK